jgi:hypothetical protein
VGRACWADFDRDGDPDVATASPEGRIRLFRNQQGNLREVSFNQSGWKALCADFNNDGAPDLYIISSKFTGTGRNILLQNRGDGTFADVTTVSGLSGNRATASAVFRDFDGDGDTDLAEAGNSGDKESAFRLFRYESGHFVRMRQESGIHFDGNAVQVLPGDFDGDGAIDLLILRWKRPALLYQNNGKAGFTDVTNKAGLKDVGGDSYSALFFDYDRDGHPDLLVTSLAPYELALQSLLRLDLQVPESTPRLFRNMNGQFEEVTRQVGFSRAYSTMQAEAADIDADGWIDILLANGGPEQFRIEPSILLKNDQGKRFTPVAFLPAFESPGNAHSLSVADTDSDGSLEIYLDSGIRISTEP